MPNFWQNRYSWAGCYLSHKVAFRWQYPKTDFSPDFEQKPRLVLANQPTMTQMLVPLINYGNVSLSLSDAGGAIILISEDLDEILSFSDRILVLRNGILIQAEAMKGPKLVA